MGFLQWARRELLPQNLRRVPSIPDRRRFLRGMLAGGAALSPAGRLFAQGGRREREEETVEDPETVRLREIANEVLMMSEEELYLEIFQHPISPDLDRYQGRLREIRAVGDSRGRLPVWTKVGSSLGRHVLINPGLAIRDNTINVFSAQDEEYWRWYVDSGYFEIESLNVGVIGGGDTQMAEDTMYCTYEESDPEASRFASLRVCGVDSEGRRVGILPTLEDDQGRHLGIVIHFHGSNPAKLDSELDVDDANIQLEAWGNYVTRLSDFIKRRHEKGIVSILTTFLSPLVISQLDSPYYDNYGLTGEQKQRQLMLYLRVNVLLIKLSEKLQVPLINFAAMHQVGGLAFSGAQDGDPMHFGRGKKPDGTDNFLANPFTMKPEDPSFLGLGANYADQVLTSVLRQLTEKYW